MCTNLLLSVPKVPGDASQGKVHASARCLELAGTLGTNIYVVPPGQSFPLVSPPVPHPLEWSNKFGFVGVGPEPKGFAQAPCFLDGLNEEGLSAAALWLPGTAYPLSGGPSNNVWFTDFVAWIVGSFARVSDLKATLQAGAAGINVMGPPTPDGPLPVGPRLPLGPTAEDVYLPLHYIVTDATGASVVIEFVDGAMNVYDSSDGVLTNAPPYPWQLANLALYPHLDTVGAQTAVVSSGPPVGSGLVGMPGDPMSSSRFVRAATWVKGMHRLPSDGSGWLPAPGGATGGSDPVQTVVNIAMQLVQVVMATPYGTLLAPSASPSTQLAVGDWTMWSLVRDHTHQDLYFTTAFNGIMRSINVKAAVAASSGARFPGFPTIALASASAPAHWHEDVTKQLSQPA
ncbi:linear amide C-N hydrolase [Sorangium sp. So ce1014]|uniref:linear amide C-N hydrolase n=1 Tax=Sorangium sp. So ce1014 TaxID=3133326 RepID=UPI003F607196